jgi:hypothetical protein
MAFRPNYKKEEKTEQRKALRAAAEGHAPDTTSVENES